MTIGIMGNVPNEDIIGAFKVENGIIVKDSYQLLNPSGLNCRHSLFRFFVPFAGGRSSQ